MPDPNANNADAIGQWKACFGDARQLGYVTTDLRRLVKFFIDNACIGPWFLAENRFLREANCRGRIMDIKLSTAHANSGGMQIEIIQPDPEQASIYSEWLARVSGKSLVQHMAWWVPDYPQAFRLAQERGYEPVMHGRSAQGGYAYFHNAGLPEFAFEVTELTPERSEKYHRIAQAAADWNGSDPIRFL
jgi:hypothetical protein